jgi:hypothetical protein
MSKFMTWCTGLALFGALAGCGQPPAARAAGSWGTAIEVPGLGALNKGGSAQVNSVSCASAGNCAADGDYQDRDRHGQGFVADERNDVWGQAVEVPGLGALNKGGSAQVNSVSCASAGNCAAGGYYTDGNRHGQGFVADERNGVWGQAIEVPGLGALNKGPGGPFAYPQTQVNSVSCASAGNCAAGGGYAAGNRHGQGFVAVEDNGVWGQVIEVPGLGALNKGGAAEVDSVSCASAGNCAVGGGYAAGTDNGQGFVAVEDNGVWGQAIEVPGLGALNKGGAAGVNSVSCASPGNCAVGGDYEDRGQNGQGFVADEKNGVWGTAINVPGLRALNDMEGSPNAEVDSVLCASAGNCAAVGTYGEPYGTGFAASETNGRWGQAETVLVGGRLAGLNSVSCASPGNCAAGGDYSDSSGGVTQGAVAVERNGRWGQAIEVPGLGTLNKGGGASVASVSCPPAGGCAAGGTYTDRGGHSQGFVVNQAVQGG